MYAVFYRLNKINYRSVDKSGLLQELETTSKQSALKRSATVEYTPNSFLSVEHALSNTTTLKDDTKYSH